MTQKPQVLTVFRSNPSEKTEDYSRQDANIISPPTTPVKRYSVNKSSPIMEFPPTPRTSLDERPESPPTFTMIKTREFKDNYTLSRRVGSGAWSEVFLAEQSSLSPPEQSGQVLGLTPPPSPGMSVRWPSKTFAIKKPSHKGARRVLSREAKVLSYLASDPASKASIITFHGLESESSSLILDFAPLTLKRYAEQGLAQAKQNMSTRNMYDPVVGESTWKHFARNLISGLEWLHSKGIAHGDIKTENILLQQRKWEPAELHETGGFDDQVAYQPLLCDFSSARLVNDQDDSSEADVDDAITTTYASPDLLASFRFVTNSLVKPVDRQKADVWAMAVCLVVAAVGVEPYAEAGSSMLRLHLAKHGDILGSVRNNSGQATRIMKGSFVAKTVAMGLALDPATRVNATEWLGRIEF